MSPQALRQGPESPGTAGPPRSSSGKGRNPPGQRVEPAGPRTQAQVARTAGTPQAPEPSRSLQGQFVDPEGLRPRARVSLDSWLNPRARGQGPDSHGTASRPHRPSEPGPSHLGPRVDPAGTWSLAEVARDIWLTPRGFGHGRESPGRPGRPRGPSGMGPGVLGQLVDRRTLDQDPSRPGDFVDIAGPRALDRVARDRRSTTPSLEPGVRCPGPLVDPGRHRARA